jgi:hypothetical protein
LDESKRPLNQHSTYPRLFSRPGWEPDSARPILELFNPDESKRAKKMLELAYPKSFQAWMRVRRLISKHSTYPGCFHDLDESQIALILSWSYSTQMRAKELKRCLSSPYPKSFQAWMRVKGR